MSVRPVTIPDVESRPSADERVAAVLRRLFPVHAHFWDDATVLDIAQFGRLKASQYGCTVEADVNSYVCLLPQLGGRFDEDPMLPWATSLLHDKSIREPGVRIERLRARTHEYIDAVCGNHNEHLRECADVIRTSWQHLIVRASQADPQTGLVFLMERTFPRKWAKAPLQLLPQFVAAGTRRAQSYEIRSSAGIILYLAFAFLFGWKFDEDPVLPLFTSILKQSPSAVPKERLLYERLVSVAEVLVREPNPTDRVRE